MLEEVKWTIGDDRGKQENELPSLLPYHETDFRVSINLWITHANANSAPSLLSMKPWHFSDALLLDAGQPEYLQTDLRSRSSYLARLLLAVMPASLLFGSGPRIPART